MLNMVRQEQFPYEAFAEELLSRIPPDGPEHIRYCLELMLIFGLRLRQHDSQQNHSIYLADILPNEGDISPANLCLLGGFTFGILAQAEAEDREWSQMLLEHVLQYQEIVRHLTADECRLLADGLIEIFPVVTAVTQ
jgi:hypothetical protein